MRSIALWGDSLTSARVFIDTALERAGMAKRTISPSFIQAAILTPGVQLPLHAACAGKGWQTAHAHQGKSGQPAFSRGFASMASANPGDAMFWDFRFPHAATRVRELTLLYEKPAPDSSLLLGIAVDGGEEKLVPLSRAPSGMLRAWSHAGAALFAGVPGVAAGYDLVLVQYGTNEGADPHFARDDYLAYLRANLARMRRFNPRARCVLIGPPDRGDAANGGLFASRIHSNVHRQIALAQMQAGAEFRCAFWNWQAAMGGPGSAVRWARMKPPRMQPDLTHMTALGYRTSGRLFAESISLDQN